MRRAPGFPRDLAVLERAAKEGRPVLLLLTGRDRNIWRCPPCKQLEHATRRKPNLEAELGRIVPGVMLLEAWVGHYGVDRLAEHIYQRGTQRGQLGVPAFYLLENVRPKPGSKIGYTFDIRPAIKGFADWRDLKTRLREVASTPAMRLDAYQDRVFSGLPRFRELWGSMAAIPTAHRPEAERLLLWPLMQRLETVPPDEFALAVQEALRLVRTAEGLSELGVADLLQSVARTDGSVAALASIQPTPMDAATPDAASADADTTTAPRCQGGVCVLA